MPCQPEFPLCFQSLRISSPAWHLFCSQRLGAARGAGPCHQPLEERSMNKTLLASAIGLAFGVAGSAWANPTNNGAETHRRDQTATANVGRSRPDGRRTANEYSRSSRTTRVEHRRPPTARPTRRPRIRTTPRPTPTARPARRPRIRTTPRPTPTARPTRRPRMRTTRRPQQQRQQGRGPRLRTMAMRPPTTAAPQPRTSATPSTPRTRRWR